MERKTLAGMLIGVAVISGCVSIEKTRTQMSSSDKADVQKAEETIFTVAAKGSDSTGLMSFDTTQRLEFLNLSSNPELMKRVAAETSDPEVFKAAADKLDPVANQATFEQIADKTEDIELFGAVLDKVDFKQPGVGMKFLTKVFDKQFEFYSNGQYRERKSYWQWLEEKEEATKNSSYSYRRGAVSIKEDDGKPEIPPTAVLAAKLVSGMTEEELVKILTDSKFNYHYWEGQHAPGYLEVPRIEGAASVQLIRVTQSPETLFKMLGGEVNDNEDENEVISSKMRLGRTYKGEDLSPAVVKKIFKLADKISDPVLAERIYDKFQENEVWMKSGDMNSIMSKMSENKIMEYALRGVRWQQYGQGGWKDGNMTHIEMSMRAASLLKNRSNTIKLLKAIFAKVDEIKDQIENNVWVSWGKDDDNRVGRLLALMPTLSGAEIVELAISGNCWQYIKEKVTEGAAYDMLIGGKATSSSMEIALLGRLPSEKVDVAVWESMKTEKGKNAAYNAMTPENKQLADKANEEYITTILAKAGEASETTMVVKGFYLGMDFKDAKRLLAHYFRDMTITEGIDGEGDNADHCLKISNQRDPFCYASVKDGKVWQFNFGQKVLADWFKYDAARYADWASAFSREHGMELKLDFLNRSERILVAAGTTGSGAINWEEVLVSLHQTIWTYKNAAKQFRITYFEDPDIKAFGGGIWGKDAAVNKYKYVSAQGGTLRLIKAKD